MRSFVVAISLVMAIAATAEGQESTTGSLTGGVIDVQGLPVPGATAGVPG